jgi:hypothetical protein
VLGVNILSSYFYHIILYFKYLKQGQFVLDVDFLSRYFYCIVFILDIFRSYTSNFWKYEIPRQTYVAFTLDVKNFDAKSPQTPS